ncbi:amino acid ABC transporter permease [Paenibacillus sp. J31TS4]|uniref:amino acid ABC transporter permease n=1 Tax=Paenibacillus sp. J31TS4 TaxID=2807195 RepID=UPI001B006AF4|nr:amino acid ABC transporter permease [Paenibacillus sp. J31TS4]GIP37216.1 amino acid ABC transporter permease [Paenibacillus sp. J31TS4]
MDFSFMSEYWGFFVKGAELTVLLSIFTVILGGIGGMLLSLMKLSRIWVLKAIATAYIEFFRGTPLLVQLFIVYFGLPQLGLSFNEFTAGVVTLSINSAAYIAEIFRAGIQGVDKGQTEAARSLGLSHRQTMRKIILPQAFRNILPALGNEFIVVIKESSIVSVIGTRELMYNADTVRSNTFQPFEPLIVAALIYFILTFALSKLLGVLERRLQARD